MSEVEIQKACWPYGRTGTWISYLRKHMKRELSCLGLALELSVGLKKALLIHGAIIRQPLIVWVLLKVYAALIMMKSLKEFLMLKNLY